MDQQGFLSKLRNSNMDTTEKQDREKDPPEINLEVGEVQAIPKRNEIIFEIGKKLFLDTITTGREFCKTMITISAGAIASYFLILQFVEIENPQDEITIFFIVTHQ